VNEEQLKRLQELLTKLKEQAKELGREFPFADDPRFKSEATLRAIEDYGKAFDDLNNQVESFADLIDGINNDLGGIAAAITATIQELGASSEGYNNIKNALRGIGRIARDLKLDQDDIVKLSEKQLQSLDRRLQQNIALYEINQAAIEQRKQELQEEIALTEQEQRRGAILSKQELKQLDKKKKELGDILTAERIINDEIQAREDAVDGVIEKEKTLSQILEARIQQRREQEKQIKKGTEQAKSLADFLGKLPLVGPSVKESFGEVQEEARKVVEETGELPENFNATGKLLGKLGPNLKKNLLNPITLSLAAITQLYKTFKQVDSASGDLAKQFNVTYNEALAIRREFVRIADASGEVFVNSGALLNTLSAINVALGTKQFTGLSDGLQDSVIFLTKLREQAGLTNEELVGVSQLVLATGESAEAITGEFLAQAQISSARQGVLVNEKELFRDIKNISAATLLSLQRSPAAIADAAATAKALGLELSQVEKIADGLLQFESSITSELEAELLIGRNLNLERARFAALNNDIATVAKEIAEQAGSAAEFSRLNRIQQQALADSVMMSREELGAQLLIQEQLGTLTGEAADRRRAVLEGLISERGLQGALNTLGQESIDTLEKQASTQEKFNAAVNKLKELFVDIAAIVGPILSGLASFVGYIADAIRMVEGSTQILGGAGVGATIGSFLGPGGTAVGGTIGAIAGAAYYALADDIVYPNKSEYGDTVIKGPEGTFKLNDRDKAVIAGTDGSFRSIDSIKSPRQAMTGQSYTIANESIFNPVSNINTSQVSTINNNTQNLDLKELLNMNKKLIEVTENQTRVLARESEMTRRSKQKLQVGVQDFGTDVSMFSSRVEFG
jgi:hypothetical protein